MNTGRLTNLLLSYAGLALAFFVVAGFAYMTTKQSEQEFAAQGQNWHRTVANVGQPLVNHKYEVTFTLENGQPARAEVNDDDLKMGMTLPILYNPEAPYEARAANAEFESGQYLMVWLMGVLGVVCVIVMVITWINPTWGTDESGT